MSDIRVRELPGPKCPQCSGASVANSRLIVHIDGKQVAVFRFVCQDCLHEFTPAISTCRRPHQ